MDVRRRAGAIAVAAVSMIVLACGSDQVPPKMTATPAAVRAAYGLLPGSCWRYRYSSGGSSLFATLSASGPDTNAVVNHMVYVTKYQPDAGGQSTDDYYDTETGGDVRLLRHIEGSGAARVNKRYEADPTPLFAHFTVDPKTKKAVLTKGDRFTTDSTPTGLPAEHHVWSVTSTAATVTLPMPFGTKQAFELNYTLGTMSARYQIAPDFGIVEFSDLSGTELRHVCAARVCDSTGACTGAPDCNLVCQ